MLPYIETSCRSSSPAIYACVYSDDTYGNACAVDTYVTGLYYSFLFQLGPS
jgi:hypothetical protein